MKKKPIKIEIYFETLKEKEDIINYAKQSGFDSVSAFLKWLIKNNILRKEGD
jgi:hypothetical protein